MDIQEVLKLEGLVFIKALLDWEERRFVDTEFRKNSTFEQINLDFGIFPPQAAYPIYFAGDIAHPRSKKIFVGINPAFSGKQADEQSFLKQRGQFDGYCQIFSDFFAAQHRGLTPYYANISGFLRRLYSIQKIDWNWLQENLIHLDLIPYHSVRTDGLKINNPRRFRQTYFEIFLRMVHYLDPSEPIFFNGFRTFANELKDSCFCDVIDFRKCDGFWTGVIEKKYEFVGLPFLTRVANGKDALVEQIKAHQSRQRRR